MAISIAEPAARKIEAFANSVTTLLLARLSMIALLPIVVWLFLQLWEGQEKISDKLDGIDKRLVRVETRLDFAAPAAPQPPPRERAAR